MQRVLFCRVDPDTCLTALILSVQPCDARLIQVRGQASWRTLFTRNCQVVAPHTPAYGNPPVVKYSIGSKDQRVVAPPDGRL